MIVSIASGKGGAGKTTVSAALAAVWDGPLAAVDLDVEEPNLHLFLHPEIASETPAYLEIPVIDEEKCDLCRACVDLCRFKALAMFGDTLMPFPDMCHGCGGCMAICPQKAISPGKRELGTVLRGLIRDSGGAGRSIGYLAGRLRVGEAMSPPLMRQVKEELTRLLETAPMDAVLDAPPGVSCPAVCAVMDSEFILLVTEPTPFGLHDFSLAFEAFAPLKKPMGAVINRAGIGDAPVAEFCRDNGLPVLAEIPYDRAVAEGYARGRTAVEANPALGPVFAGVISAMRAAVAKMAAKEAPCAR